MNLRGRKTITPEAETTEKPLNTSKKSMKYWAASQTSYQSAYWPPKIPALKRMKGKIHRTPVHQSTRKMRINWKWSSRRPYSLKETSSPSEKSGENQYKRSHKKCFISRHFFKVARFCNLNLLSKRLKFRVKFHSENRCQV